MASTSVDRLFFCTLCEKNCESEASAIAHMYDVHQLQLHIPDKNESCEKQDKEIIKKKYQIFDCSFCKKTWNSKGALFRHVRQVHKMLPFDSNHGKKVRCPKMSCSSLEFLDRSELRMHIKEVHGVTVDLCVKKFQIMNEFQLWKENVEKETNSKFVLSYEICRNKSKFYYFRCPRTGKSSSKPNSKKNIKSVKVDGHCPASMDVVVAGKEIEVKFWKTHFGHSYDLDNTIPSQENVGIANTFHKGARFTQVLEQVRESLLESDVQRIHLLNYKDLHNICRAFNINYKENSPVKEHPNLNAWIESIKLLGDDCPVICYKDKGIEEMNLKKPELFLVVMTKLQQKVLQWCENSIVCIDCIFHTITFSYYLITLMTIDAYDVGCPLAYCVTNRINERTVSLFYNAVKTTIGPISANLFMSVDKPIFYSEWKNIMGSTEHQLLCDWDIEKSWRKQLEKIPSMTIEKKLKLYKNMRLILQEKQYENFQSMLDETLCQLEEDDKTKDFANSFRSMYMGRSNMWAHCYRSSYVLHAYSLLEKIHKELYLCYMEGKGVPSIVRVLNLVIGVSRDKIMEKSAKLPRELVTELYVNGSQILENEEFDVIKAARDDEEKQRQMFTIEDDYTFVKHDDGRPCLPDCNSICSICGICVHKFTCTCVDNFSYLDICRHIQASINSLKEKCIHLNVQDTSNQSENIFQNVERDEIVETCVDDGMDFSDSDSQSVVPDKENEMENQSTDIVAVDFQNLLLQKIECFQHIVKDGTCKPENYSLINDYFDKIFELFTEE